MRNIPETRYTRSEEGYVAFQVFGRGAFDLLFIGNWASNIEVMWEHRAMARFLNRLGRFARVICFDERGADVSDPVPLGALPTRRSCSIGQVIAATGRRWAAIWPGTFPAPGR